LWKEKVMDNCYHTNFLTGAQLFFAEGRIFSGGCGGRESVVESRQRRGEGMKRLLFVCHGNICRSPMAEFVMKDLVEKAGRRGDFEIASAATSGEEIGNPVYPPARRELAKHGISCAGKTARRLTGEDYHRYDLIIGMDRANLRNMSRLFGGDPEGKLRLLLDYTDRHKGTPRGPGEADCGGEVADPWYTGDFTATWRDVLAGCQGLLAALTRGEDR